MRNISIILVLLTAATACQEDFYPPGFYASQVEYMLSGGGTGKVWYVSDLTVDGVAQDLSTCEDSVKILFSGKIGAVEVYDLRYRPGCTAYDTIHYGGLTVSSNSKLFTDSLLFGEGEIDFLIVDFIDPENVQWTLKDSTISVYTLTSQL